MSRVISLRIRDDQSARLGRLARRFGRKPSEMAMILVEEALRTAEYSHIEFRDSAVGRQAYIIGTGLAVWEVAMVARDDDGDAEAVARHLRWPLVRVKAALRYATDFKSEIDAALADNDSYDFAAVSRLLPQTEPFFVDDPMTGAEE